MGHSLVQTSEYFPSSESLEKPDWFMCWVKPRHLSCVVGRDLNKYWVIAGKSIVVYYSAVGGIESLPFRFHFERINPSKAELRPRPIPLLKAFGIAFLKIL